MSSDLQVHGLFFYIYLFYSIFYVSTSESGLINDMACPASQVEMCNVFSVGREWYGRANGGDFPVRQSVIFYLLSHFIYFSGGDH